MKLIYQIGQLEAQVRAKDERIAELERMIELLENQAHIDVLTGLLNRRGAQELWERIVNRAKRDGHEVIIVMCDVNRFKHINDSLGHQRGDLALQGIASRLKELMRIGDVVARWGGDEFVIIATIKNGELDLEKFATRIYGATRFEVSSRLGPSAIVELSVGAVSHQAGSSLEDEIGRADTHLYAAKKLRDAGTPTISTGSLPE